MGRTNRTEIGKMKRKYLDILCRPHCARALSAASRGANRDAVREGVLFCRTCERRFAVKDGIVHFIEFEKLENSDRRHENFRRRFSSHLYELCTRIEFAFYGARKRPVTYASIALVP
jgi:uncharacterized protein YbaR (Trm112 family)